MSHRAPVLAGVLFLVVCAAASVVAQARRDFTVSARKYAYTVSDSTAPEIRVHKDDMVTITFSTDDIPHTFTIADDHYRIDRRVERGKPVTFRFLAATAGEFEIRCTLTADDRCKDMKGKLIVSAQH
jgi:heme/copper-type cytochrome/quinol oxidase subunit 2